MTAYAGKNCVKKFFISPLSLRTLCGITLLNNIATKDSRRHTQLLKIITENLPIEVTNLLNNLDELIFELQELQHIIFIPLYGVESFNSGIETTTLLVKKLRNAPY